MSTGAELAFLANFPVYQSKLFNISAVQAGYNLALGYIIFIFSALLMGLLLWLIGPQVSVSLLSILAIAAFVALMFLKAECGMAVVGLYSALTASMISLYGKFVPAKALGLGGALLWASSLISGGIYSFITGFILEHYKGRTGASIALYFIIGLFLLAALFLVILWCRDSSSNDDDSNERLLDASSKSLNEH